MKLKILTFGIARDIVGGSLFEFDFTEGGSVTDLKQALLTQYPRFESLAALKIAVNTEYGTDDLIIKETDEIALIPPVSGG